MKMSRVAVSGAHGFIGSKLIAALQKKMGSPRVYSIIRKSPKGLPNTYRCDFSDRSDVLQVLKHIRPSFLIHAVGSSNGSVEDLFSKNVLSTLHLLQAARELKHPMRIVVLGSAAEYGETKGRSSASRTALKPKTPYAWTKTCQTLLASQCARSGQNVVVARLFNLSGPGVPERFSIGSFAHQITACEQSGKNTITVGNLNSYRDFLDIRDAAEAIILIAEKGKSGEAYDVCSGSSVSMKWILQDLIRLSGKAIRIRRVGTRQISDLSFSLGDPSLIKRLGWRPRITRQKSLQDTLQFYRDLSA